MKQAVYKILNTTRYEYEIYNWSYGNEIEKAFGKSLSTAETDVKKYIEEALICDERIYSVENFEAERNGNILKLKFNVNTYAGTVEAESEVKI